MNLWIDAHCLEASCYEMVFTGLVLVLAVFSNCFASRTEIDLLAVLLSN